MFWQRLILVAFRLLGELTFLVDFLLRHVGSGFFRLRALFGFEARPPIERWGLLPSLYRTLTSRQIFFLEWSTEQRYSGNYLLSRMIFEHFLPSSSSLPILALERATLYEFEGLDGLSVTCLNEAIAAQQSLGWEISSPVFRLMKIRIASAGFYAYGHLRQALEEARALQPWLDSQDHLSYTDVTVHSCHAQYINLCSIVSY